MTLISKSSGPVSIALTKASVEFDQSVASYLSQRRTCMFVITLRLSSV